MDGTFSSLADPLAVTSRAPDVTGRSKKVWRLEDGRCVVQLVPSLSSFTYQRESMMEGTARLRLDFYEECARRMAEAGLPGVFLGRLGPDTYLAEYVESPPFEVIVKNVAQGSTTRKYPGLFPEGHRFVRPVVKFDYRTEPEDQPIAEDYIREFGCDSQAMKALALSVNALLLDWLRPRDLWDVCFIIGGRADGAMTVTSEISPDCMRLKAADGASLDKDLFRHGAGEAEIVEAWTHLVEDVRRR